MSFNQTFMIYNYTPDELTLDSGNSKNLSGVWPATIPGGTAADPGFVEFSQDESFSVDINPTAIYILQSDPSITATLHFYCAGVGLTVQVTETLTYSTTPNFSSAIWQDNTNPAESSIGSNNLAIGDFGNNSSRGTAKFVIGESSIPS